MNIEYSKLKLPKKIINLAAEIVATNCVCDMKKPKRNINKHRNEKLDPNVIRDCRCLIYLSMSHIILRMIKLAARIIPEYTGIAPSILQLVE